MNNEELSKLKKRMENRAWNLANPEKRRALNAKHNPRHSTNIHRPDGRQSEILRRCRFKCLAMGGDPGCTQAMRMAILEVGYESPELQRGIFHPDFLNRTAGQWSSCWRHSSQEFRNKTLEMYKSSRVDCDEFEPLQPEND